MDRLKTLLEEAKRQIDECDRLAREIIEGYNQLLR